MTIQEKQEKGMEQEHAKSRTNSPYEAFVFDDKIVLKFLGGKEGSNLHKKILEERQQLLDKLFDGTISPEEENMLCFVRYLLHKKEEEENRLDRLAELVVNYEKCLEGIENLREKLERVASAHQKENKKDGKTKCNRRLKIDEKDNHCSSSKLWPLESNG